MKLRQTLAMDQKRKLTRNKPASQGKSTKTQQQFFHFCLLQKYDIKCRHAHSGIVAGWWFISYWTEVHPESVRKRLRERLGIGTQTAAILMTVAGDNPERLRSEAALAALRGLVPFRPHQEKRRDTG